MSERQVAPFALVLMPFDKRFDDVYKLGILEACKKLGIRCERVDEQIYEDHVVEHIYSQIKVADVIIADISNKSPNVYYELGFARALKRTIITIVKNIEEVPFDLRSYPHIVYEDSISKLREELGSKLQWAVTLPEKPLDLLEVYERSADVQGRIGDFIDSAKEEILFSAVHFNITISDRRREFLAALKRGVHLTFVVLDPDSKAVYITADAYAMRRGELKAECLTSIELLKGFHEDAKPVISQPTSGTLKILVSGHLPRGRFMLFDPQTVNGVVIFIPYVDLLRSSHSPCYVFPSSSTLAKVYINSYQNTVTGAKELTLDSADERRRMDEV